MGRRKPSLPSPSRLATARAPAGLIALVRALARAAAADVVRASSAERVPERSGTSIPNEGPDDPHA